VKEARTARRRPGPRRPSRICSRRAVNTDQICRRGTHIPDHKGRQGRQGVLRSRDFEDGKVAETSTHAGSVRTPKTDPVPRPPAWLARVGRPVRRRPQDTPGWPAPATEARTPSCPHGQAGRRVTSRAMSAADVNAGRHPYSLDWENLSDAERNLRVRLSETRP
jgi:hypothetical protein